MKVFCINDACAFNGKHTYLKFGETYEAVNESLNKDGQPCYMIPELPLTYTDAGKPNEAPLYKKKRFIELPDQSADEMKEAEFEAIVNLETV